MDLLSLLRRSRGRQQIALVKPLECAADEGGDKRRGGPAGHLGVDDVEDLPPQGGISPVVEHETAAAPRPQVSAHAGFSVVSPRFATRAAAIASASCVL